jgi:hypothetical protein
MSYQFILIYQFVVNPKPVRCPNVKVVKVVEVVVEVVVVYPVAVIGRSKKS